VSWAAFTGRVSTLANDAARLAEGAVLATVVPGLDVDPWLAALVISQLLDEMDPDDQPEWREAPLSRWKPRIRARLAQWQATVAPVPAPPPGVPPTRVDDVPALARLEPPAPASPAAPGGPLAQLEPPAPGTPETLGPAVESATPIVVKPPAAVEIVTPEGDDGAPPPSPGASSTAIIPAPPPGLPEVTREAWIQARLRAGEYVRGLGNRIAAFTHDVTRERWDGAEPDAVPEPDARREKLDLIRRRVSDAVARGEGPAQLASELGNATLEWSRDWKRIARTELQAVRNEGAIVYAHRTWGEDARICRVPQRGACKRCLELFLEPNGWPRVFTVRELVGNGVNVGRKASDWLATAYPVHPNCRCDVVVLPPRMRLNAQLQLVPA